MSGSRAVSKYSRAFVFDSGRKWDFDPVEEIANELVFVADYSSPPLEDRLEQITNNLRDFDPEQDVLVPVGRSVISFMIGAMLPKDVTTVNLAIFHNSTQSYTVTKIQLRE